LLKGYHGGAGDFWTSPHRNVQTGTGPVTRLTMEKKRIQNRSSNGPHKEVALGEEKTKENRVPKY